jgi:predicted ATP-dependent protease
MLDIADVISEACYWAGEAGHPIVLAGDVGQAIRAKEHRANLVEAQLEELIEDGTLAIETSGERVGQVNGVAVIDLGDYVFGRPSRISARVALGDGTLQSIEREIKLSGPIHAKGFLILSGYLAGQYAQELPLSIGATITFEQSYDEIEGDSASSTELYVLLSALAGLPLRQGIAVTGSVNQYGDVQAVGGVTQKIEGFFAVCKARGLTGDQGVIIPASNVKNLMLSDDVVAAVRAGEFHVWAVRTIDEGIELLTGRPAGQRDEHGHFPEGCVHRLVEERLRRYAEGMRTFSSHNGVARRSREQSRS